MPYTHEKVGDEYEVYKNGKKVGSTKGTKEALDKYLAALHIHADDKTKKESKTLKENEQLVVQDSPEDPYSHPNPAPHPGCEDKIGDIFVVLKPKADSEPENIIQKTHAFGMGHINPMGVHGVYGEEDEATLEAESAIREHRKKLNKLEEKKAQVVNKLNKHISKLHKEVKHHLEEAIKTPDIAESHHSQAKLKMERIKHLSEKRKMVENSKKPLPKKAEKK